MGLEEKRWIKDGQERMVPEFQSRVTEVVGKVIPCEVDWNSFASDLEALQNLENQGLGRIFDAIRWVSRDSVGKEAIQKGLAKIVLTNLSDSSRKKVTLKDQTLEFQAALGKGGYFTDTEIAQALEAGL